MSIVINIFLYSSFKEYDDEFLCTKAQDHEAHLSQRRRPRGGKKSRKTEKMVMKELKEEKDSFSGDGGMFGRLLAQNWTAPEIKKSHQAGVIDDLKTCGGHATPFLQQDLSFFFPPLN